MLENIIKNIYALFLIILFGIRLLNKKSFKNMETKFFWLTLVSCFLLIIQYILEDIASKDPNMWFWRTLLTVLGYTLRSTAALGLLLVILPRKYRYPYWWIPCGLVFAINCTAFFSKLAFWFTVEDYSFRRGPLGIVSFIVPIFYIVVILFLSIRQLFGKKGIEKFIVPVCILFCAVATIIGVYYGGCDLIAAIMTSSVFFYMVLYSHDNRLDPLTSLFNRQAFYDDCVSLSKSIKAVASLDMNGLKEINDTLGHQYGDEALKKIGECLVDSKNNNMSVYRVGGDEFVILFFYDNDEKIIDTLNKVKEKVSNCGYSISVGYATSGLDSNINDMIKESDRLMYIDKANYYQTSGIERRRSRVIKEDPKDIAS